MMSDIWRGARFALALTCAAVEAAAQTGPTAPSKTTVVDGDPLITQWVVPEYPAEMKAQKVQGHVTVQMVIDESGKMSNLRVTKSSDPRFNDAVLKALNACQFAPAIEDGKPIPAGVELGWTFSLPYHPPKDHPPIDEPLHSLPKTPATADFNPDPVYPVSLLDRHLDGQVIVDLKIGKDGGVSDFKILDTSHADFIQPAIEAVKQWKFHPAKRGDLAVTDVKRAPMSFFYEGRLATDQRSQLEANGFVLQVPEGKEAKEVCTREPEILSMVNPVFPMELLALGEPGEAEVSFTVTIQGYAEDVSVKRTSHPSCGLSLAAAVEANLFKPALLNGQAVAVTLVAKQRFALPADTPENDEPAEMRLLRIIKSGEKIPGSRGLDATLVPLWRAVPKYPSLLRAEKPQGSAVIELIVDKAGRARIPKIISTSRAEFGWAAATALGQWVFVPPQRGGEPVDVRVQVPVQFSGP